MMELLPLHKSPRSLSSFGMQISIAVILFLKMSTVSSMIEDYYNPDYDEIANANNGGMAVGNWGKADEMLGKQLIQENLKDEMSKRHLGALAASGAYGSRLGMRPGNILPNHGGDEMTKRHLGSVAASSGTGSRLAPRLGQNYGRDEMMAKRHLGSVAAVSGIRPRVIKSYSDFNSELNDVDHEVNSNPALASRFLIKDLNPNENEAGGESSAESPKRAEFVDDQTLLKGKRFLGSMARGGWFPRQFRGFIEQPMDKRHIGAVARLGWIPYNSKMNRLDEGGEGSFKRNVQSLRKNSLTRPGGN